MIDLLILLSCHHTDPDLRIHIDKSSSHSVPVKIMDDHNITILKFSHNRINFIIEYPKTARLKHTPFALFQCCNR